MKVYKAINAVQKKLAESGIGKNQSNDFDKYKYRGIDDVYNVLGGILADCELAIIPKVLQRQVSERQSNKGSIMFHVALEVQFALVSCEDGSSHDMIVWGEAMDRSDKATNKALSAAYKYAVFNCFCIPIDGQDADSESPQVVASEPTLLTQAQKKVIAQLLVDTQSDADRFYQAFKCASLDDFDSKFFEKAVAALNSKLEKSNADS